MLGHILVVDDDNRIRQLIQRFLQENDYAISTAANIKECESLLKEFSFDIIIMDVMMPGESGIDFIKRTRDTLQTPVLMLSAMGHVDDRIDGLESGAEDYITKPFEPKELLLRIQNIMKRTLSDGENNICVFGDFRFDTVSGNLVLNNEQVHLTTTEKKLLTVLSLRAGNIISRDELLESFKDVNLRTIDAQIARLRGKIEKDPKSPEFLQTMRGSGYVLWGKYNT